jgi:hypothetical protein
LRTITRVFTEATVEAWFLFRGGFADAAERPLSSTGGDRQLGRRRCTETALSLRFRA